MVLLVPPLAAIVMGTFGPDISITATTGALAGSRPSGDGFTVVLGGPELLPLVVARALLGTSLTPGAPLLTWWRMLKVALARKVRR